ncbi:MAG: Co2+/Mg2+ efflux protein ApaG [Methylococcus sp.]
MNSPPLIRIDAHVDYLEAESHPASHRHVFAYTITIRNEGSEPAQLLARHWVITDANDKLQEIRGEGVVGEKPRILPGQAFRYTSAAMIETPVGIMRGEYHMRSDSGELFDAIIPPFTLAVPGTLH